ncbi:unnamed protein product [Hymenolepis diminuta]|uniref:Tudor domain-containing protein n=1 Tax=Hymenolepis diminuta TaxID=6216 RepID=A0A0R3SSI9_HYMDI|nr:unnamed protein product [Hymenolepis diminuta]
MDSIETAKIAAIVRCIMEQMNLSKPDKDPEDYIKNVVSREGWKSLDHPKLDKIPFKLSSASGDAVQLSGVMKCELTFKGKTIATVCYVADRDINLVGLDWIDMFDVLKPKVRSIISPHVRIREKYRRTEDFSQADDLSPLIKNQPAKDEETVVAEDKKNGIAVNTPVYVRDYRMGHQWTAAIVKKRHGSVIYDVDVGKDTRRLTGPTSDKRHLSLHSLVDTFNLTHVLPPRSQVIDQVTVPSRTARTRWKPSRL